MNFRARLHSRYRYPIILCGRWSAPTSSCATRGRCSATCGRSCGPGHLHHPLRRVREFLRLGAEIPYYAIYLLLGIVLWGFFSETTSQGLASLVARGDLLRKINFPRYVVVLSVGGSVLISFVLNMVVIVVFMVAASGAGAPRHPLAAAAVPRLVALSLAVAFFLSALYVRFRDLNYIWEVVHAGGVLRHADPLPAHPGPRRVGAQLLVLNPMAQIIQDARYVLVTDETRRSTQLYGTPWVRAHPGGHHARAGRVSRWSTSGAGRATSPRRPEWPSPSSRCGTSPRTSCCRTCGSTTLKSRFINMFRSSRDPRGPARPARRQLRGQPGRVLRHRRAQRLRQEHPAEDPRGHLRADGGGVASRPARAVHRARRRFQPRAHRPRQRLPQRRDAGLLPARGRRHVRRHRRVRRARGLHGPEAQELLLGHAGAHRLLRGHAGHADILLIDEVLAVGDAAFQQKCFDHFRASRSSGTTIVFVTHDMDAVREFCDRAVLIEEAASGGRGQRRGRRRGVREAVHPGARGRDDRARLTCRPGRRLVRQAPGDAGPCVTHGCTYPVGQARDRAGLHWAFQARSLHCSGPVLHGHGADVAAAADGRPFRRRARHLYLGSR